MTQQKSTKAGIILLDGRDQVRKCWQIIDQYHETKEVEQIKTKQIEVEAEVNLQNLITAQLISLLQNLPKLH